ncbi:MAG: glycosyltransferase family 2 protein [Thermoleophilia bacterium]|nr:glycosyltransferase family 2 protein [Thermoleophilia bacterium]
MRGVAVVIPARDEAPTIGAVVAGARAVLPGARVLVVDDASRDPTATAARGAGAEVVRLRRHAGYAGALRAGYGAALAGGARAVAQMDGDGQHRPEDLGALLAALEDHDLVLGSRFLAGRPGYRVPVGRRMGMAACRWMAARVGDLALSDPTSGFRALRRPVAERLAREGFPGGLTETSLLIHLHRAGVRLTEVPVRMLPPSGRSMHRGLAGGAHFLRISWAVLALASQGQHKDAMFTEGDGEPR